MTKSLIKTKANIIPDYKNEILSVQLFFLLKPRDNIAAKEICQNLNDSETKFPGTNLKLVYKFAINLNCYKLVSYEFIGKCLSVYRV